MTAVSGRATAAAGSGVGGLAATARFIPGDVVKTARCPVRGRRGKAACAISRADAKLCSAGPRARMMACSNGPGTMISGRASWMDVGPRPWRSASWLVSAA
ncbi:MAG: hypothetical protein H6745_21725 [Deltaproteobacteria bacterium]|nr:hypothetical protein [Deltaproteobacteria bacterium]